MIEHDIEFYRQMYENDPDGIKYISKGFKQMNEHCDHLMKNAILIGDLDICNAISNLTLAIDDINNLIKQKHAEINFKEEDDE